MPTAPAQPLEDALPDEPPPGYEPGPRPAPTDSKKPLQDMSAPAATGGPSSSLDEDARLAARLQAEEDAMARTSSRQEEQFPQQLPPRDRDKSKSGFLGKLFNKAKSPAPASPGAHGDYRPQQQAGYYQPQSPQPPQQQQQYGAYAGQASYPPNAGYNAGYGGAYGGQYRGPYGGGYGGPPGQAYHQQQQQQQQPQRRTGGMGAMGPGLAGAALGVGAGVLGGAMISNAINDHQQDAYMEGYGTDPFSTLIPLLLLLADAHNARWQRTAWTTIMAAMTLAAATLAATSEPHQIPPFSPPRAKLRWRKGFPADNMERRRWKTQGRGPDAGFVASIPCRRQRCLCRDCT